tara:strand:+ start:8353 stop:8544 length:192 start_codon:yes stop_codon:yes gene_type:complete
LGVPFVTKGLEKCHCTVSNWTMHSNVMLINSDYVKLRKECRVCGTIEYCGTVIALEKPGRLVM